MFRTALKHVADGGTIAEEVISTIRTAQAFGTQRVLVELYDNNVIGARDVEIKIAVLHGICMSVFFFVIYSAYGLAFSFGTTLIIHGHGEFCLWTLAFGYELIALSSADVGVIVNVFIAIMIGSFSLALLAPEAQGK